MSTARANGAAENKHHSQTHVQDPWPGNPPPAAGLLPPEALLRLLLPTQSPCSHPGFLVIPVALHAAPAVSPSLLLPCPRPIQEPRNSSRLLSMAFTGQSGLCCLLPNSTHLKPHSSPPPTGSPPGGTRCPHLAACNGCSTSAGSWEMLSERLLVPRLVLYGKTTGSRAGKPGFQSELDH